MAAYIDMISEQFEKEGYPETLMKQFAGKLVTWLINHVAADDRQISDFINK